MNVIKPKWTKRKIILLSIIGIFILWISTLFMNFTLCGHKPNTNYEYVMKNVIKNETKLIDIAMLGSHDAFSNEITLASKPNTAEGGVPNILAVNLFAKGLSVRMARAQNSDAKEQLYSGVRYFDARITYHDGIYSTHHGYLSGNLSGYIEDIVEFLSTHPGEIIILDIQQFYTPEDYNNSLPKEAWQALYDYMNTITAIDGSMLKNYVAYTTSTKINELTYGELTHNGEIASIVLLGKTSTMDIIYHRDGDASHENPNNENIRSYWHCKNSTKDMIRGINEEMNYIKENHIDSCLVVNQAQQTGFTKDISILRGVSKWSLLDMAASFNKQAIKDEARFKEWLEYMPIYMADNVTSHQGSFNKLANQYIKEYNETL